MANIFEIFYRFLILGLISFGGPMAHLGYFRNIFVEKLQWLDEEAYAKLIALSQFLPGPSSSQVGFSIGLKRGGLIGGIIAFIAFTFPSFFILYLLASFNVSENDNNFITGVITGLKLFSVVIVADAALGMFKSFCKSTISKAIFIFSTIVLILFSSIYIQFIVLILSAIIGSLLLKNKTTTTEELKTKKIKIIPFVLFLLPLFIIPIFASSSDSVKLFNAFYEAGTLVFGGGHVVLPLLEQSLGDMITNDTFLLGYSLAQAVPGPMFTIASYLGASIFTHNPLLGAFIATIAIFLPGFLLILTFRESFEIYTKKRRILNAIAGVNAAVVGFLVAVFFNTVFPSAVNSIFDLIIVAIGLYLFQKFKISVLYMIVIFIGIGLIIA
jgi:chromate transporter